MKVSQLVPSFFVAYTREDEDFAVLVCSLLRDFGFEVYSMTDNPKGPDSYVKKGQEEMARHMCLVVLVSENESDWVEREAHEGREACERREGGKCMFPIICCKDPKFAKWPNSIDRYGNYVHIHSPTDEDAAEKLATGLVQFGLLDKGIVPLKFLQRTREFRVNPFDGREQFAMELIEQPLRVRRGGGELHVIVNRQQPGGARYAVISNEGKRQLQQAFVHPRKQQVAEQEKRLAEIVLGTGSVVALNEETTLPAGLPMRWVSGGVLPLVTFRQKRWVVMLFRDIPPYGWNLPLGASERYFGERNVQVATKLWEDELLRPEKLATREFLEEILVLDRDPAVGPGGLVRRFQFFRELQDALHERYREFSQRHIAMRNSEDCLVIQATGGDVIPVNEQQVGRCFVDVLVGDRSNPYHGFLVSVNPLEMGIELVLPLSFELRDNDYILDGEIVSYLGISELVRMPVALISVDYLKRAFPVAAALRYVDVELAGDDPLFQPSARAPSVDSGIRFGDGDIHLFDWDARRRREIAEVADEQESSEVKRHKRWVNLFGAYFEGGPEGLPGWFTPTAAKTIQLANSFGLL